jgi:hypothetical protein
MVGRAPFGKDSSDTTTINAPIIPVNIDLRMQTEVSGSAPRPTARGPSLPRTAPHVTPVLNSPVFPNARHTSSERKTQFTDAVHRASFFKVADDDWHTPSRPA